MNELKPIIGVCGPSGSGKSSSLENLPEGTVIYDLERKGFPFDVRKKKFTVIPIGDSFDPTGKPSNTAFSAFKKSYLEEVAKKPPVIVIDGLLKLTQFIFGYSFALEKGFDAFRSFNKGVGNTLEMVKNPHSYVVILGINEVAMQEQATEAKTVVDSPINCFAIETGKEKRGKIEQDMLIVFHTQVVPHKDKPNEHYFLTQTDGINTAKSPKWMGFPKRIPNDLGPVIKKLQEAGV